MAWRCLGSGFSGCRRGPACTAFFFAAPLPADFDARFAVVFFSSLRALAASASRWIARCLPEPRLASLLARTVLRVAVFRVAMADLTGGGMPDDPKAASVESA